MCAQSRARCHSDRFGWFRMSDYTHGPCPECDHRLASEVEDGIFQCRRCWCKFAGQRKVRKRLTTRRPLKTRAKLRSHAPLTVRTPLKKVNRRRAAKRKKRDFGDLAEFVRANFPCCVVGCGEHDVVAAHARSRGASGHAWVTAPDGSRSGNIAPLCWRCHQAQHSEGIRSFESPRSFVVRGPFGVQRCSTLAEVARVVGEVAMNSGVRPPSDK